MRKRPVTFLSTDFECKQPTTNFGNGSYMYFQLSHGWVRNRKGARSDCMSLRRPAPESVADLPNVCCKRFAVTRESPNSVLHRKCQHKFCIHCALRRSSAV